MSWMANGVKIIPQVNGEYLMLTVSESKDGVGWICQVERVNSHDEQMAFSGLCFGGNSLESARSAAEEIALKFLDQEA